MRRSMTNKLVSTFWMSVLLHLLLLFILIKFVKLEAIEKQNEKKSPHLYMKSYVYTGAITPSVSHQSQPSTPHTQSNLESKQHLNEDLPKEVKNSLSIHKAHELEIQREQKNVNAVKNQTSHKSILAASHEALQKIQSREMKAQKDEEPIYLVGDLNTVADPIIKLLGRALTAHFEYPKVAEELGITGRVLIGLTLHPGGHFSDVQMISSSNNRDLDAAALYAVNTAPLIKGANRFISKPKHFVVGFIFREY